MRMWKYEMMIQIYNVCTVWLCGLWPEYGFHAFIMSVMETEVVIAVQWKRVHFLFLKCQQTYMSIMFHTQPTNKNIPYAHFFSSSFFFPYWHALSHQHNFKDHPSYDIRGGVTDLALIRMFWEGLVSCWLCPLIQHEAVCCVLGLWSFLHPSSGNTHSTVLLIRLTAFEPRPSVWHQTVQSLLYLKHIYIVCLIIHIFVGTVMATGCVDSATLICSLPLHKRSSLTWIIFCTVLYCIVLYCTVCFSHKHFFKCIAYLRVVRPMSESLLVREQIEEEAAINHKSIFIIFSNE